MRQSLIVIDARVRSWMVLVQNIPGGFSVANQRSFVVVLSMAIKPCLLFVGVSLVVGQPIVSASYCARLLISRSFSRFTCLPRVPNLRTASR